MVKQPYWYWALFFFLLWGCGGALGPARTTLSVAAESLNTLDREMAPQYANVAAIALERANTQEEYTQLLEGWNALERTMRDAKAALLLAQGLLDVYEKAAGVHEFLDAMTALTQAMSEVRDALNLAEVPVPSELTRAINMVKQLIHKEEDL